MQWGLPGMQVCNFLCINFRFESIEPNYFNEIEADERSATASNKRNEDNISLCSVEFSQLEQKFHEFSKFGKITKA